MEDTVLTTPSDSQMEPESEQKTEMVTDTVQEPEMAETEESAVQEAEEFVEQEAEPEQEELVEQETEPEAQGSAEQEAETMTECAGQDVPEPPEEVESEQQTQLPNDVEQLKEMVMALTEKLNEMNKLFVDRIAYCEYEQKIIDDMHKELQKYKQDMNFQLVKPILMDIIDMRNSMLMNAKLCQKKPENERVIPLDTFLTFAEGDAENILLVNDVMIYDAQVGEKFDPAKQRAVKKVKTENQEQHGLIADVMGSGYERNGKVLSPLKVAVYVYEKPAEPVESVETTESTSPEA